MLLNLPNPIRALATQLEVASSPETVAAAWAAASGSGEYDVAGHLVLRHSGYQLERMLTLYAGPLLQKLAAIEPLQLSLAPTIAGVADLPENEKLLIFTYPGLHSAWLAPYSPDAAGHAKARFLAELQALADAGWQHRFAARGKAHWFINPDTGTIVLDAWHSMAELPEAERDAYLDAIARLLESP